MTTFTLDERYVREAGPVYLTGVQALVRAVLDRVRHDRRSGADHAAFVSGYEGSARGRPGRARHRTGPRRARGAGSLAPRASTRPPRRRRTGAHPRHPGHRADRLPERGLRPHHAEFVEQVRTRAGDGPLNRAVAHNLHKLKAYKD